MKKYVVIKGIFEGRVFMGDIINDRVYDRNSQGRSYPIKNCALYISSCNNLTNIRIK